MNIISLSEWLRNKLRENGLSQAELSRRSGISEAQISRVISGENAGEEFCRSIASALNLPPEAVFRAAGLLPPIPEDEAEFEEWQHLLSQLPLYERERLYKIGLLILEEQEKNNNHPNK